MSDQLESTVNAANVCGDELLDKLLHLKQYEVPEVARMTRSRQNIIREVRELNSRKRKSFGDVLELSLPWFFAEPKYGVALLVVAFAGLQYLSINARNAALSDTGIYTSRDRFADYEQLDSSSATNSVQYEDVSPGLRYFNDPKGSGEVKWANYLKK